MGERILSWHCCSIGGGEIIKVNLRGLGLFTLFIFALIQWGCTCRSERHPPSPSSLSLALSRGEVTAGEAVDVDVAVLNAQGITLTSYVGNIHFSSSDPLASVPQDYTFTASDLGRRVFPGGAIFKTAGEQRLIAADTARPELQNEAVILVQPKGAVSLSISGIPDPYPICGTRSITVRALDPYGNTATGYTGTVYFSSSDSAALLPAAYTFSSIDSGRHTFADGLVLNTLGVQTITATDMNNPQITTNKTVAVGPDNIRVAVVDRETALPIQGASVMLGSSPGQPFSGNSGITDSSGTITLPGVGCSNTITAGKSGYAYLTVIDTRNKDIVLPLRSNSILNVLTVGNTNGSLEDLTDPNPPATFPLLTPIQNCDGELDIAITLASLGYEDLLRFSLFSLFGPFINAGLIFCTGSCPFASCLFGMTIPFLPSNVLYPSQRDVIAMAGTPYTIQTMKTEYFVTVDPNTTIHVGGAGGKLQTNILEEILSGVRPFTDILANIDVRGFAISRNLAVGGSDLPYVGYNLDIPVYNNLTVNVDNMPPGLSFLALAGVDLTGSTNARRLLLSGVSGGSSDTGATLTLTTVNSSGLISDARIVPGVVVADFMMSTPNPYGFVGVLDRQGYIGTGSPISTTISSFFSIPSTDVSQPQYFSWSDVYRPGISPVPQVSWSFLGYPYTTARGNIVIDRRHISWEVLSKGSASGFTLPVLPSAFPSDPSPGNNGYSWYLSVVALTQGGASYDFNTSPDFDFILETATHDAGNFLYPIPSIGLTSTDSTTCVPPCDQTTVTGYVILGSLAGATQVQVQSSAGGNMIVPVLSDGSFNAEDLLVFEPACPGMSTTDIQITPLDSVGTPVLPNYTYTFFQDC